MTKSTKNQENTLDESIKKISKDVTKVKKQIASLSITNEDEAKKANEVLLIIKKSLKSAEEERKFFVDPLNKHVKDINKRYKEKTSLLNDAEKVVKKAIGDFQLKKIMEARREEEKRQAMLDKKNQKRLEQGKEIDLMPIEETVKPDVTIETKNGMSYSKLVWKFEIKDIHKLPEEIKNRILELALTKGVAFTIIKREVDNGTREMSGVRIYEDVNVSGRAE